MHESNISLEVTTQTLQHATFKYMFARKFLRDTHYTCIRG